MHNDTITYPIEQIRADFPVLTQKVYNKPFVYLDNAATTQKPNAVINTINQFYLEANSNIHRGVHYLSEQATERYEAAREKVRAFIGAPKKKEVIFTSGTTHSINIVANGFAESFLKKDDEIIVSIAEHHANLVPWQQACQKTGARLRIIPVDHEGQLHLDELAGLISPKTKIIAISEVSNVLGTINPVHDIINIAHQNNIPVLVDAAQAVQHGKTNVHELDADFYVFSGHKIYAPTGIGVLYGKEEWLDKLPPFHFGGNMVDQVTIEETTFNELPFKFEAGTTNYVATLGLQSAIEYLENTGLASIRQHEKQLTSYAARRLSEIKGLKLYGTTKNKHPIFSFLLEGIHFFDAGMILDKMGLALRTGTHCAQPLMQSYEVEGMIRASFGMYNTKDEVDQLVSALEKTKAMLK